MHVAQAGAQTVSTTPSASNLGAYMTVIQARADMAAGIIGGKETVSTALVRLKTLSAPAWCQFDPDGDYSSAAIQIGHRLLAAGKSVEAELFFRAAEQSLVSVLARTPDSEPVIKAGYLGNLALIRGRYLGNPVQAVRDVTQALSLLPNDSNLTALRDSIGRDKAELLKSPING